MNPTIFIFGRTPGLSLLELQSLYPEAVALGQGMGIVSSAVVPQEAIRVLGGTVKIATVMSQGDPTVDALLTLLLAGLSDKRLTFGVSTYGNVTLPAHILVTLKKELESRGISARYIETKHGEQLSSVVVAKQQLIELVVCEHAGNHYLARTAAVQDFEDWNKRDYGRPAVDPKSGMLPPKVARMIVNIALAGSDPATKPMLLDPFCGMGTVLAEALLRGASVAGADISVSAVESTKKNLTWLRHEYPEVSALYANVMHGDATHISALIAPHSIDAIATEPFMGENLDAKDAAGLTPERVKNTLRGLENLYIGALKEWSTILKPGARVVMAMPAYVMGSKVTRVKRTVDRCESLGYTLLTEPIEYSRPQAVVRREFFVFRKH